MDAGSSGASDAIPGHGDVVSRQRAGAIVPAQSVHRHVVVAVDDAVSVAVLNESINYLI